MTGQETKQNGSGECMGRAGGLCNKQDRAQRNGAQGTCNSCTGAGAASPRRLVLQTARPAVLPNPSDLHASEQRVYRIAGRASKGAADGNPAAHLRATASSMPVAERRVRGKTG